MDIADKLYITEVNLTFDDADTFFPDINKNIWNLIYESNMLYNEDLEYKFKEYKKIKF